MTPALIARRAASRLSHLADRLSHTTLGDGLALLVEHRLMTVLGDIGIVEDLLPSPRPARPEPARREAIQP